MNIHNNARLTPIGRERILMQVASGLTPQAAAHPVVHRLGLRLRFDETSFATMR
jgi:hypothetical protein